MARIRTIKPEFFTSEDIVCLSMAARLLYIALWCEADREGRMQWKPRTFKMRYFPADAIDIDACARELLDAGLVVTYGDALAYIPAFSKHQHINPREAASALPEPSKNDASARVSDASARVHAPSVTRREEGKGKEGKGIEEELPSTTGEKPAEEPADPIFGTGLALLVRKGVPERSARSFLGMFRKTCADDLVAAELLVQAEIADVSEPWAWLTKAAKARKAGPQLSLVPPPKPEPVKASHRDLTMPKSLPLP